MFLQEAVPEKDPIPGAVIAMQTWMRDLLERTEFDWLQNLVMLEWQGQQHGALYITGDTIYYQGRSLREFAACDGQPVQAICCITPPVL